jgi:pimeloyl-ACP methyl ester carboxylesterase
MYLTDVSLVQTAAADNIAAERILKPNYAGRVTVGNIKMYYQIYGQGEPLLMIMGLGGHSLDWGWIVPQKLADRYKIILFDNRGSGRSDQSGPCTIEQMAKDTIGLMDALAIDRAHVFGGSMGGMIALQMALDHPEHVNKLVLGATSAGGKSRVFPPPEIQKYFYPRQDLSAHDYLLWTGVVCYPQEFIDAHPDTVERKIQANLAYPGTLASYMAQLEAFMAFNVDERLNTILVPTMIIIGNQDVLTPPPNSFRIAGAIPGAQIREIDGAGHIFWISHPEETVKIVTEFLGF